ncbi:MAG: glutamate--tRNA ligase, partial [Ilumatobacteraceae bacterium]
MSNAPRYRFAPSPPGFFHVGGARTALFNWALARRTGGTFVLRIEDTDEARNRPEWTQGIIDALAWIGIAADDPHFEGPLFQSDNIEAHLAAADRLAASGYAYYCDMTPDQIAQRAAADGVTGYGGWSRDRGLGPAPGSVLRFRVPEGSTVVRDLVRGDVTFDHAALEDFVLVRGNGTPVFNLANVVDDMTMGITHDVRAAEHLPNTPKQQKSWTALGAEPPVWAHVPVLVNEQRKKLSKRRDKVALEQYRAEGYLAEAMVNYLMTLGWSPGDEEIQPWSAIESAFRLEDVNLSPAFFDLKKLAAFNGEYIRKLSVEELVAACEPWIP